jgi:uncharacterized membrane protein
LNEQVKPQSRLVSLDLVRVLAMALMVQGHTLDVLLTPAVQSAPWYNFWLFCRGFTAPVFMTLAGFSFALATLKRWDDYTTLTAPAWKRLRRFSFFLLLGYSMRFPVHSIRDFKWVGQEGWQAFLQLDVLQTIGFTLIALQLLVIATRSRRIFALVCGGLSLLIAFAAPLAWNSVLVNALPLPIRSALVGTAGSPFPLLPWSAYIFLGGALGTAYVTLTGANARVLRWAIPAGLTLIAIGVKTEGFFHYVIGDANFWPSTPHLFLTRVGFVTALVGLASMAERYIPVKAATVRSLAEESLVVYFVHVAILYGSIWSPGIKQYIGGSMDFAHAYIVVLMMISAMLLMAYHWNRAKKSHPWPTFAFRTAIFAVAAIAIS